MGYSNKEEWQKMCEIQGEGQGNVSPKMKGDSVRTFWGLWVRVQPPPLDGNLCLVESLPGEASMMISTVPLPVQHLSLEENPSLHCY